MSARVVHLVRHGRAGVRGTWPGSDLERPLDEHGEAQAAALAGLLDGTATSLWTSPTARCRGTLAPLSERTGLALVDADALAEGVPTDEVLGWLAARDDGAVCCTHGEVLEDLLAVLVAAGVGDPDTPRPKGGRWELTLVDGVPRGLVAHRAVA